MTTYVKLKTIYRLALLSLPLAIILGTSRDWLLAILVYSCFQVVGVGVAIHRFSAHRSFQTYAPIKFLLLCIGTLSTIGSSISWSGLHRLHHKNSDTEADPHSPYFTSIGAIVRGSYMEKVTIPSSLIRDLAADKMQVFFHRHYFKVIGLYILALALFGWKFVLFGYFVPVAMVYWVTAFGIVMNHKWGYRNFATPDHSVNSWALSLMTWGDGWHNNHHFDPANPSHSVRLWEFDLCYWLIRCVRVRA